MVTLLYNCHKALLLKTLVGIHRLHCGHTTKRKQVRTASVMEINESLLQYLNSDINIDLLLMCKCETICHNQKGHPKLT